jgi:TolA-binding protein/anti-sigma factor RsiW
LLERKSPPLTHAERLRVEAHLAECDDCRREHAAMTTLTGLVEQRVESAAKSSVQDRAIARALLKAGSPQTREVAEAGRVGSGAGARLAWGFALAAAVALLAFGWSRLGGETAPVPQHAAAVDQVKAGLLLVEGKPLTAGERVPADRELQTPGAFEVSLAHASLKVQQAQSLRWDAAQRTVELPSAIVDVEVDPAVHQSFRVVTSNFLVDVLGTSFRVERNTVSVVRGRVRVLSLGQQTLAELGPGQSWTFRTPEAAGEAAEASSPAPAGEPSGARKPSAPVDSAALGSDRSDALPVAERLARARSRLASGDVRGARADLEQVLAGGGSRAQQAEAQMLKAECSLVEGDRSGAVRQYLDVKQRFAGTRVAETALFAAARVESNRGAKAAAKQLLLEYQARYPKGQFRSDVDARLKMLE